MFCAKHDAVWFRYVDDVKVFTKNYDDARRVVFVINDALRAMHLNLQSAKTAVLCGKKLEDEIYDPQLEMINQIIKSVGEARSSGQGEKIKALLRPSGAVISRFTRGLPHSVLGLDGKESRLLRRCLTLHGLAGSSRLKQVAICAVCRVPDVRVLRSGIGYLTKLPERHHDEVADAFYQALLDDELLFPYQAAQIIDAFKYLAFADTKTMASRLRQIGWKRKMHWYVRQKTLEAIAVLPYKAGSAEALVREGLRDPHPWVRRAAAVLLPRGGVQFVRDMVNSLSYYADPEVARIALYWRRHLENVQCATQAMSAKSGRERTTREIIGRVPMLYLLRCTEVRSIAKSLQMYIDKYLKNATNPTMTWHCQSIRRQLGEWLE